MMKVKNQHHFYTEVYLESFAFIASTFYGSYTSRYYAKLSMWMVTESSFNEEFVVDFNTIKTFGSHYDIKKYIEKSFLTRYYDLMERTYDTL